MKTILFTPMILDTEERFQRNVKWVNYYLPLKKKLGYDKIVMVDNASPPEMLAKFEKTFPQIHIIKKHIRLERISHLGYGYWYRAFKEAARFCRFAEYNKIIHIDSDGFVLSNKLCTYIKDTNTGWHSLYCNMYGFPETIIQVIGMDKITEMYEFMDEGFLQTYPNQSAETITPFTNINKEFIGDRYGEKLGIIQDPSWDYVAQVPNRS